MLALRMLIKLLFFFQLSKQCGKLADLDKDLDTIRCQLADWHGQTNAEGDGDRDVCRVQ